MKTMNIAVACHNASGVPDMPVFSVTVSDTDYAYGIHYDKAKALAADAGYERPFVCFDDTEQNAILSAARSLNLVPRLVVVDMTDGAIHSVRCDAGDINVICYDESDTNPSSESVMERLIGFEGETLNCWAHVQKADIDPGLKKAREIEAPDM